MFEVRGPLMVSRQYLPATMKVDVYRKDIAIIKAYAAQLRCPTPLFTLSESFYEAAYAQDYAEADTASVHAVLRQRAGLPVGARRKRATARRPSAGARSKLRRASRRTSPARR
jgi:hypothetical protein